MMRPPDELQSIPGIGPSIAVDLRDLGYKRVADLQGEDPQKMYDRLIRIRGSHQDRCVLYVFRCAVYYASRAKRDPEKLKWWNWSDENLVRRKR
jgi:hypothetical protein